LYENRKYWDEIRRTGMRNGRPGMRRESAEMMFWDDYRRSLNNRSWGQGQEELE
jgi:hypothetical protein